MSSIVDNVLKRWVKDLALLEKAAVAEERKITENNKVIDSKISENLASENEAKRARQVVSNLQALLVTPTEAPVA